MPGKTSKLKERNELQIDSLRPQLNPTTDSTGLILFNSQIVNHLRIYAAIEEELHKDVSTPNTKPKLELDIVNQLCQECHTFSEISCMEFVLKIKNILNDLEHRIENPQPCNLGKSAYMI